MTRVLIVDDSPFVCRLLASYIQSSPDLEVAGIAHGGREAVAKVRELRPDVVTMDLDMPGVDGLQAVRQIMTESPVPVLVVSGVSGSAATRTLQALDYGAVDFILKYTPGVNTDAAALTKEILAKVRAGAHTRVVRLLGHRDSIPHPPPPKFDKEMLERFETQQSSSMPSVVVVIGASTGGPLALRELLSELPADMPAAVLVVQHLPRNFTSALAAQLRRYCGLEVREAEDGDTLHAGLVLVAPGGYHLLARPSMRVAVQSGPEVDGHCPSIDVTMESAAFAYGSRVAGVVLTGMGEDGTKGLRAIRSKGGVAYAQEPESCVVNGMPQSAMDAGLVEHLGTPAGIGRMLAAAFKSGERRIYAAAS